MKKFIIERTLPINSELSFPELVEISKKSNDVISRLGTPYHWNQTIVCRKKLYCIHIADDASTILTHSEKSGFPADSINEVITIIDPTTAHLKPEE